ncbi:MAG TPA: hypothetical protein VLZ78_07860 [Terrimesophilobacter sp.]|nr:hypothetical protein [Terrimesophilobacter sp.]
MSQFLVPNFQDRAAYEKGLADLFLEFTAGTSGAIPTSPTRALGIVWSGVTLTATGLITIPLQMPWPFNIICVANVTQNSLSASTGMVCTPDKTTDVASATAPKIAFNLLTAAGARANMGTSDVFRMHAILTNSKY